MTTLSGHMIVKNGIKFDYPFIESCLSILPICDEFIFIEGKSEDGTYEKLLELQKIHSKIKIIQADWNKKHYSILSDLTNLAIENCKCDYHFQIQADEVVHEIYLNKLIDLINQTKADFYFLGVIHFFSNFDTIYKKNVYYDKFVRLAKRSLYPSVRSYDDAMTLGRFSNFNFYCEDIKDKIIVNHYGYVRNPKSLIEKAQEMFPWWGIKEIDSFLQEGLDNNKIDWFKKHSLDKLEKYNHGHPIVMLDWIAQRKLKVQEGIVQNIDSN